MPRAVAPLLRRSWLSIKPGEDRRERIIAITNEGQRHLMKAGPIWASVQKALLEQIGSDNWQTLMPALKGVREGAAKVAGRR